MTTLRLKTMLSLRQAFKSQLRSNSTFAVPSAYSGIKEQIQQEIQGLHDNGTIKNEREIIGPQGAYVDIKLSNGEIVKQLNFCANNYLGFSNNPRIREAMKKAVDQYGAGVSSVRFICGTQSIHRELEEEIARFHGREAAIIYPSCFDANAGLFEIIMGEGDVIITDSLNHASIIDGIRLKNKKCAKEIYQHMDVEDLERILKNHSDKRRKMVVTDGVFSMDGDIAPLPEIGALCAKYDAMLMIDECHGTGFLGETGRGTEELLGCEGVSTIINSTMGKALGGAAGGYTTGPKEVIELLRNRSRPYSFSNSIPAAVAAACLEAFKIINEEGPQLSAELAQKTAQFRQGMTARGFTISGDDHPISPVMVYDSHKAQALGKMMAERGIFVIPFSFPVVASGKERIRTQISVVHSEEDIERTMDAFAECGKELGII